MGKPSAFGGDILKLILQGVAIADLAEDDSSSPATNLYASLHTANPGESGDQSTSEVAYTSYARVAVVRSGSGWTVTGDAAENAAAVTFPKATGGTATALFWGVGTAASGTGKLLYYGPIGSVVGPGIGNTDDTIDSPSHGLAEDDQVVVYPADGESLPTGLTEGTVYYVIASGLTTDAFKVSTSEGGSAVDITAAGTLTIRKLSGLAISNNITPEFAAGALDIVEG